MSNATEAELLSRLQEVRVEKTRDRARKAAKEFEISGALGLDVPQFELELSDQINPLFSSVDVQV